MFDINDLKKNRKNRLETRAKIFDNVLTQCLKKITFISKNSNATYIWYKVPLLIPGQPIFNIEECIEYLLGKLKNYGFTTNYVKPNNIYISWETILKEDNKSSDNSVNNLFKGLSFKTKKK